MPEPNLLGRVADQLAEADRAAALAAESSFTPEPFDAAALIEAVRTDDNGGGALTAESLLEVVRADAGAPEAAAVLETIRGGRKPARPALPEAVPVPDYIKAFFPKRPITPEAVDAGRLVDEMAAVAPRERVAAPVEPKRVEIPVVADQAGIAAIEANRAGLEGRVGYAEEADRTRRWIDVKNKAAMRAADFGLPGAAKITPLPGEPIEPLAAEEPGYGEYLLHGTKERALLPWRGLKSVQAMAAVDRMLDAEIAYRIEHGLDTPQDQVRVREWTEWARTVPAKVQQRMREDGTWQRHAGSTFMDTSKLRENLNAELLNGLPMYAPANHEAQDKLYGLIADASPKELPAAKGVWKKLAAFGGEIVPFVAELAILRKATLPLAKRVAARAPAAVEPIATGLAFGAEAALRGEEPFEAMATGAALPVVGRLGAGAAQAVGARAGLGAGVGTGALFAGQAAAGGGDLVDVLIAGVVTPLVFHAKDIIRYPFRPRAMVVYDGRGPEPPRSIDDLATGWGMSGKLIQRFVNLATEIGKDPYRNAPQHLRSYDVEIRNTAMGLEKLYQGREKLPPHERMLLEGFFAHYDAVTVGKRTPAERGPGVQGPRVREPEKPAEPVPTEVRPIETTARPPVVTAPEPPTRPTAPPLGAVMTTSGEAVTAPVQAESTDLNGMRTELLRILKLVRTKDLTRESWDQLEGRQRLLKRLISEEWERTRRVEGAEGPRVPGAVTLEPSTPQPPLRPTELAMEFQRPVEEGAERRRGEGVKGRALEPSGPGTLGPTRRVGLARAEQDVLDIHARHADVITGAEPEAFVRAPEEAGESPYRAGYTFSDTPEGRSAANELKERLPEGLTREVRIQRPGDVWRPDGLDVMADIGTDAMARAIEDFAGRGKGPMIEATAAFVEASPELFTPEEMYAVRRYRQAQQAPETAAAALPARPQVIRGADLTVGDKVRIAGELHEVVDIDPETRAVTLQDGDTIIVEPEEPIAIDRGTLRDAVGAPVAPGGVPAPTTGAPGAEPLREPPEAAPGAALSPAKEYAAILNALPELRRALRRAEGKVAEGGDPDLWQPRVNWLQQRVNEFTRETQELKQRLIEEGRAEPAAAVLEEIRELYRGIMDDVPKLTAAAVEAREKMEEAIRVSGEYTAIPAQAWRKRLKWLNNRIDEITGREPGKVAPSGLPAAETEGIIEVEEPRDVERAEREIEPTTPRTLEPSTLEGPPVGPGVPPRLGEEAPGVLEGVPPEGLPVPPGERPGGPVVPGAGEAGARPPEPIDTGRPERIPDLGDRGRPGVPAERRGAAGPLEPAAEPTGRLERPGAGRAEQRARASSPTGSDYVIGPEEVVFPRGEKGRVRANFAAIRLARQVIEEGRLATPEEKATLVQYSGWGTVRAIWTGEYAYTEAEKGWEPLYKEMEELLSPDEMIAARGAQLNAMFTSPAIIRGMYRAVAEFGFQGGAVLEPAVGVGHFFGAMPPELRSACRRVGVELEPVSAGIAKILYPESDVRVSGFEAARLPKDYFDLVISNVPFGAYGVVDARYPDFLTDLIHDYFFARSLDLTRPGCVLAFITSSGTLNKRESRVRRHLAKSADFLGAIRLNQESLPGTKVTADIIFLRKRPEGADVGGESWTEAVPITVPFPDEGGDVTRHVNEYFVKHPEMVLGRIQAGSQYGRGEGKGDTVVVPSEDSLTLAQVIDKLPKGIISERGDPTAILPEEPAELVPAPDNLPGNAYAVHEGRIRQVDREGNLVDVEAEILAEPRGKERLRRLKDLVRLRDSVLTLQRAMLTEGTTDEVIWGLQQKLNKEYDSLVRLYRTFIHGPRRSLRDALEGDEFSRAVLMGLENWRPEEPTPGAMRRKGEKPSKGLALKADIFSERVLTPFAPPTRADSLDDAVKISLNEVASLDFERIADLVSMTPQEVISELLESRQVFRAPEGRYVIRDEYLSGYVRDKLEQAEAGNDIEPGRYDANIEELRKVIPPDLGPEDIKVCLGSDWVPPQTVQAFAADIFQEAGARRGRLRITYTAETGRWYVLDEFRVGMDEAARAQWGTAGMNHVKILEAALNLKLPTIYKRVVDPVTGDERRVRDEEETESVHGKIEDMQERFQAWIWESAERVDVLVPAYNRRFNGCTQREWSGEHLTFPGMSPQWRQKLRAYQAAGVAHIIINKNVLLYMHVGSGKTAIMAAAAMELKRLKIARKSLIVVQTKTFEQFPREAQDIYPAAKIISLAPEDMTPAKRRESLAKIAFGDWDIVILSHETMKRIPMSEETLREYFNEKINELREAQSALDPREDRRGVRDLETAIKNYEKRLAQRLAAIKKDKTALSFEDLGVDYVFYDESQALKNLAYVTSMQRVKGLGAAGGNQITDDAEMKARWIVKRNNGRGLVFSSGTPVANSLVELYTVMKYLIRPDLQRLGIENLDSWARVFTTIEEKMDKAVEGVYRPMTRMRAYRNVPELLRLFWSFTDIVTEQELIEKYGVKLPLVAKNTQGERDWETIVIPESEELRKHMASVGNLAQWIRDNWIEAKEQGITFLRVVDQMKKGALDLRLVSADAEILERNKMSFAVAKIAELWQKYRAGSKHIPEQLRDEDIGKGLTQVVFLHQGLSTRTEWGFLLVEDFIAKLTGAGIPRDEIAFINHWEGKKSQALFDAVNAGRIRVVIGSSQKLGVGVNIQKLLVAAHLLDPPYRPDQVRQGRGRIVRPGNLNEEVHLYRYVAEGSGDEWLYNIIFMKALGLDRLLQGDLSVREIEDVDPETMTFGTAFALASNNPLIKEFQDQEQVVRKLEYRLAGFERSTKRQQYALAAARDALQKYREASSLIQQFIQRRGDPGNFNMTIGADSYDKPGEAGKAILAALAAEAGGAGAIVRLGKVGEIELKAEGRKADKDAEVLIAGVVQRVTQVTWVLGMDFGEARRVLEHGVAVTTDASAVGVAQGLWNRYATRPAAELQSATNQATEAAERIAALEKVAGRGFPEAEKLEAARAEMEDLEQRMHAVSEEHARGREAEQRAVAEPTAIPEAGGGRFIGGELSPDQEAYLRKLGPDKPGFGLGAMADIPDPRGVWKRSYDALREKLLHPKTDLGKKLAKYFGRGLYGPAWGLSERDYNLFETLPGTLRLKQVQARDLAREIEQRAGKLDRLIGGEGLEAANLALANVFDGKEPPETLDPDLRKVYDVTMGRTNEVTDRWESMPWLHQYAEAWGLRNLAEIIRLRREGNAGWLRRVFQPEKPKPLREGQKNERYYALRPRLRTGLFKLRRADLGSELELWTLEHSDGTATQYPDADLAEEAWIKEQDAQLKRFGVSPEDYRAGEVELAPGVADALGRIKLLDPFGEENIVNREPIKDVRIRIARTLEDWALNVQILDVYHQMAELHGRIEEPSPEEGLPEHVQIPDHAIFGPLAGMWLPEPVAYNVLALKKVKTAVLDQVWSVFNYAWKSAHVVWSPRTWMNNLWGLHFSYMLDGLHPSLHKKWFVEAHRQFRDRGTDWQRLMKANVINVGWSHEVWEQLDTYLKEPRATVSRAVMKWFHWAKVANNKLGSWYDYPDQLSKLAAYLRHRYQNGMSHDAALHEVDTWYPNYARPGNYARWARKSPLGVSFIMFSEQYAKIGIRAARDRPARLLFLWMLPKLLEKVAMITLGITAAELLVINADRRRKRKGILDGPLGWMTDAVNQWFQPIMPWRTRDGKLQWFDLRWKFPLADEFRVESGEGGIGVPFIFNTPFTEMLLTTAGHDTYTGRELWHRDDTADTKLLKYLWHAAKESAPVPTLVDRGLGKMIDAARDGDKSFARVFLHEFFGVAPKAPWIRREDIFNEAKRLLNEKQYGTFRDVLKIYNELYRSDWAKPIRASAVSKSVRREKKEEILRERAAAR